MIRILLVDDHVLFRQGTRALLSDAGDIEVVGECGEASEALAMVEALAPHVIVLDIRLAQGNGIEVARQLRHMGAATKILMLSAYAYETYVRSLFAVGVDGYLLKSATADELVDAIRAAYRGAQVVSREIAAHQAATVWQAGSTAAPHLSQRELEILCLVRDGSNNRKIADALQLSVRTVEAYLSHAMAKLGARSRAEAVNQAKHAGLMGDE